MPDSRKREHIFYFDLLRVFAMLGVVYMHLSSARLTNPENRGWTALMLPNCIFFTAVPLFFMISGALLLSDPATDDPSTLARRLPRLIIPLFVWSAAALALDNISLLIRTGNFDIPGYIKELLSVFLHEAAVPYWFMYYLIPIYLLSPFLSAAARRMSDRAWKYMTILLTAVFLYKTAYALFPAIIPRFEIIERLYILSGCLAFFIFGYRLHTMKNEINNLILISVAAADTALIFFGTLDLSKNGTYDQTYQIYDLIFMTILSVCLFLLAKQNAHLMGARVKRVISALAKHSYAVYLIHVPVIFILPSIGIDITKTSGVIISLVFVPVLCFAISLVASKIPFFSYILTGSHNASKKSK